MTCLEKLDRIMGKRSVYYIISAVGCLCCAVYCSVRLAELLTLYLNAPGLSGEVVYLHEILSGYYKPSLVTVVCSAIVPLAYIFAGAAYVYSVVKRERYEPYRLIGLCACVCGGVLCAGAFPMLATVVAGAISLLPRVLMVLGAACSLIGAGVLMLRSVRSKCMLLILTIAAVLLLRINVGMELYGVFDIGAAAMLAGAAIAKAAGKRGKTLYVSDLDGTLLRSDETTSDFTNSAINTLVENGMLFSYATARSYRTAKKVTQGLNAKIPLIVYNGAMIADNIDGSFIMKNFFGDDAHDILTELLANDIYPIVYSIIDGAEKFSYIPKQCTDGMAEFVATRKGDVRENAVTTREELYLGEIFYFTCIGEREKLEPLYEVFKDKYHCVFQVDMYTKAQWLEIMPREASKANAAKKLKELLGCDRIVAFGDGSNDVDLFEFADEAYAVENAAEGLKAIATDVIESNDSDGVAKWLLYRR